MGIALVGWNGGQDTSGTLGRAPIRSRPSQPAGAMMPVLSDADDRSRKGHRVGSSSLWVSPNLRSTQTSSTSNQSTPGNPDRSVLARLRRPLTRLGRTARGRKASTRRDSLRSPTASPQHPASWLRCFSLLELTFPLGCRSSGELCHRLVGGDHQLHAGPLGRDETLTGHWVGGSAGSEEGVVRGALDCTEETEGRRTRTAPGERGLTARRRSSRG
jgi:hypothetical protein